MAVQWTPALSVGVEIIDEQHRELFRRFNDLIDACHQHKGKEKVEELLGFLDDYVITHFREEESLMDRYSYSDAEEHKEQHRYFKRKLKALQQDLLKDGPNLNLVVNTNQTTLRWLVEHIKRVDTKLGSYLKSRD